MAGICKVATGHTMISPTRAEQVMMKISDSYPSERDDLFTDAHKQWDWHDKAVRYEFPDGSAIISGKIWGEKVINALGFNQVTVDAEPEKMFVPMYLWGDGEEEDPRYNQLGEGLTAELTDYEWSKLRLACLNLKISIEEFTRTALLDSIDKYELVWTP